ncbi:MAG: radical SAM protein [Desulfosporosinus sp.]
MKASLYNILVNAPDGSVVLYTTRTGGMTRFNADERSLIERALCGGTSHQPEIDQVMLSQGHLVEDDFDEEASVRMKRKIGIVDKNRLDIVLLPTLDCNFRCVYCYEEHRKEYMSDEVAKKIIKLFEAEIPSAKLALLHWFGGEPLLTPNIVAEITSQAFQIAKRAGVKLVPQMTTNGYLLHGDQLRNLLDVGILDYQITIDGNRDSHNKMRVASNGVGTYDVIVNNCRTLLENPKTSLTFRINFNHQNIESVSDVLDEFLPKTRKRIRLVLEPIFGDDNVSATANLDPEYISTFLDSIYARSVQMGYGSSAADVNFIPEKLVYCYAERERQFIIGPSGDVFKCAAMDFKHENRLGELTDKGTVAWDDKFKDWMDQGESFKPVCDRCVYLPLCMGGCRSAQFANDGETCSLIATNASRILQMISRRNLEEKIAAVK